MSLDQKETQDFHKMFSTVANMNGNIITTGWTVKFLLVLGDFFKYQKTQKHFKFKRQSQERLQVSWETHLWHLFSCYQFVIQIQSTEIFKKYDSYHHWFCLCVQKAPKIILFILFNICHSTSHSSPTDFSGLFHLNKNEVEWLQVQ